MPKESEIDVGKVALLVGPMGQPIKMVAESLGITEYKVRKVIKENSLEKSSESAADIIISKAFNRKLPQGEYIKQKALAGKLFKEAPDVRFWKAFDFSKYTAFSCLSYFTTGFLKQLRKAYVQFEKIVDSHGLIEGATVIAKKIHPDKDLTQTNNQWIMTEAVNMFKDIPDMEFWESFNIMSEFPEYKAGSLRYFRTEIAKKLIRSRYNQFKYVPPTVEVIELSEHKIGDDAQVKSRARSVIDFLNS